MKFADHIHTVLSMYTTDFLAPPSRQSLHFNSTTANNGKLKAFLLVLLLKPRKTEKYSSNIHKCLHF